MKQEKKDKRAAKRTTDGPAPTPARSGPAVTAAPGGSGKIDWRALLTDWRVALVLVLVLVSAIVIYPHFEDGKIETNLQFGLDLNEGAWLQLDLQSEVVTFQTTEKVEDFVSNLSTALDTDVHWSDRTRLRYVSRSPTRRFERRSRQLAGRSSRSSRASRRRLQRTSSGSSRTRSTASVHGTRRSTPSPA